MKKNPWMLFLIGLASVSGVLLTSCEKETTEEPVTPTQQFVGLESPYLICASRNPGGVGFDFVYKGAKGGGEQPGFPLGS